MFRAFFTRALRNRVVAACGLVAGSAFLYACSDILAPESAVSSSTTAFAISDGETGGNPKFNFLPPMVKNPKTSGTFDATLSPTVEICEVAQNACLGAPIAVFTKTSGQGSEKLAVNGNHYAANWNTKSFPVKSEKTYRISVLIGSARIGFADVAVASNSKLAKEINTAENIALVNGSTLPIKFWIETGMVVSMTVSPSPLNLVVGATAPMTAVLKDARGNTVAGQAVTWSGAGGAATVNATGVVTGVSAGASAVTASSNGLAVTAQVNVTSPAPSVTIPGAVVVTGVVANNGAATVSFTPAPSNSASVPTSYTVTSSPGGLTATGAASPIVVTGLTNGTAYTFTVVASNSAGSGAASVASPVVTPVSAPSAPTDVAVTASSGAASVAFTAANGNGSPVTSYTVTAMPGNISATGSASPIAVSGLTDGVAYTFTVTATNALGTSSASAVSAPVTPVGLPGAVTISGVTTGNGTATVAFSPPSVTGGQPITGYTVTSAPGGFTATGAASPLTVTGLTNGVAYTFTVVAVNASGSGAASAPSAAGATPAGPPGTPTVTSITPGSGQVSVAFAAPASNGGSPITAYTVTSSPGGISATGAASPIIVSGLTDGTVYTFTVSAANALGASPSSVTSASVTPVGVPTAPLGVSAIMGVGSATVSFSAPSSNGGLAISSYTVTSAPGGISASGATSPIVVSGLPASGSYTFTVTATNSAGTSVSSAPSAASVALQVPGAAVITGVTAGIGSATVTFAAPSSDGGSAITSYKVMSTAGGFFAEGSSSPLTVTGLTNGHAYSFVVQASNAVGPSALSAASEPIVPASIPDAPFAVTAVAGNGRAVISFSAGSDNGSGITSYTVTSSPSTIVAVGSGSPIEVSGLANGVGYTFSVTARNGIGSSATSVPSNSVTPVGVPGVATVTGVSVANGSATVAFSAPADAGGLPITSYTVTSNPGGLSATGTSSPLTVTGLTNGVPYTFSVVATNAAGSGAASAFSEVSAVPVGPPDAPSNVTVISAGNTATVSFNAPANTGGLGITSYTVTSVPDGRTATGSSSPLIVTGLTAGTAYTFIVTATNSAGTSAASGASAPVTPVSVPGSATITGVSTGNGQAIVSFTPPFNTGGLPITSYTVTSSPGGLTATGASSPLTVTGLTNGTAYTFTVVAANAQGSGVQSAPSTEAAVPVGAPSAPTSVTATAASGSALVSFNPPDNTGGSAITSYTVTSSPGGITASSASSPVLVSGLTNGVSYTFTVTASNAAGTSVWSSATPSVTPTGVAGAPSVTAVSAGSGQVVVSFDAPASNGGLDISSYVVTASPGGQMVTTSSSPATVTGLTNGVAYTFTVVAINAAGSSAPSAASNPASPAGVPDAPRNVTVSTTGTSAAVSFIAPVSDGGSAITIYTVTSSPGGMTSSGSGSPVTVSGLTAGVSYTFTVTATNANGSSVSSAPSASATIVSVPDAPTVLSVAAGNGQAVVEFARGADGGSAITQYIVTSSPGGISKVGTSSPISVTGLTNGTSYTFTVRALNATGTSLPSTASAGVIPTGWPGAPTAVVATIAGTTATVSFTPPVDNGGLPITSYRVTSSPGGLFAVGTSSPIAISGLTAGTSYTFTVAATNAGGVGEASAASPPVIVAAVPGAPTINSAAAGNGQVTVQFTPPANNGGSPILSYTVTSSPGGFTATGSASPLTVTGLTNGTSYTFRVTATNATGTGAASGASGNLIPRGPPGSPTGVVATQGTVADRVNVKFTLPSSNGGSAITGYTVTSSPGNRTITGAASPLILSGLTPGVAYTFTVVALNAIGSSPASAPSASFTPLGLPTPPSITAVTPIAGGAVIAFNPPTSNGGLPITGYIVRESVGGTTFNGTSSPITVTGLTPGLAYSFTVRSVNSFGASVASAASAPITIPAAGVTDILLVFNPNLGAYINTRSGFLFNESTGSETDPIDGSLKVPPRANLASLTIVKLGASDGKLYLTYDATTGRYYTYRWTFVDLGQALEFDRDGNPVSTLDVANTFIITAANTLVDAFDGVDAGNARIQFDPRTWASTPPLGQVPLLATPPSWMIQ